jgi:hypothetical protein
MKILTAGMNHQLSMVEPNGLTWSSLENFVLAVYTFY